MKKSSGLPRVIVVGGGAGGLELVARLAKKLGKKKQALITLVDSSPVHLWKPLLHEVAAGTLNSFEDELNYLAYASEHGFQFCLGSLQGLDRANKEIILAPLAEAGMALMPERKLSYDILVIAIGSISNDFNIPGVRDHCLFIDSSEQANQFQKILLKAMTYFPYRQDEAETFNIAIVGGGATGVELAAELHYAVRQMANYGIRFDPQNISINLIEAADRLLPALSPRLSQLAETELKKLDITIYTNEQVSAVTEDGLFTKNGKFISATIKTWAAGIKAPDILKNMDGLEVNKINQLIVKPTLQTTVDDAIFAFGDCACCLGANDKAVPPRAQSAHQQASMLANSIRYYLQQKPLPVFQYKDHGSLINFSHYETIGNLMGRITNSMLIEGKFARFAYLSLYRMHQIALHGTWRVAILIFVNFLTRKIRPRLKLH